MKIAVTGASGFLGRHVIAEFRRRGIDVLASSRSVKMFGASPEQKVVSLDIHDPPPDAYAVLGHPDVLVHLAWSGLPNYNSLHHFETELPTQYRFLSQLVRSGLKRLTVTGTCFEYGMRHGPLCEQLECSPTNPYGFAKDTLRRQLGYLEGDEDFSLTWLRLFYLYGDGQNPKSLYSQLLASVAAGERTFKMSGGEQLRDFLSITEAARLLVELSVNDVVSGVVNVCSGRATSVRALVEGWINENQWPIVPELGHYPYPDYEPFAFWGDRAKLDRLIGCSGE